MSEEVKVIGIDTNILVRIITRDDEKHSQIALDYVSNSSTPFIINHIVEKVQHISPPILTYLIISMNSSLLLIL